MLKNIRDSFEASDFPRDELLENKSKGSSAMLFSGYRICDKNCIIAVDIDTIHIIHEEEEGDKCNVHIVTNAVACSCMTFGLWTASSPVASDLYQMMRTYASSTSCNYVRYSSNTCIHELDIDDIESIISTQHTYTGDELFCLFKNYTVSSVHRQTNLGRIVVQFKHTEAYIVLEDIIILDIDILLDLQHTLVGHRISHAYPSNGFMSILSDVGIGVQIPNVPAVKGLRWLRTNVAHDVVSLHDVIVKMRDVRLTNGIRAFQRLWRRWWYEPNADGYVRFASRMYDKDSKL